MAYTWPLATVGSIVQVTLVVDHNAQRLINTFHYRLESNGSNQNIESIMDGLDADFGGANSFYQRYRELRSSDTTLDFVNIQFIEPTRYVAKTYDKADGGLVVSFDDPQHICASIERRAVIGGRKGVGRVQVPAPIVSGVGGTISNGDWSADYFAKLQAFAAQMQAGRNLAVGATLAPVIYHRPLGKPPVPQVPNYDYVGVTFAQPGIRAQRTRVLGRGI